MINATIKPANTSGAAIDPLPFLGGFPNGSPSRRNNSTLRYIDPAATLYAVKITASRTPQYYQIQSGSVSAGTALTANSNAQKTPREKERRLARGAVRNTHPARY